MWLSARSFTRGAVASGSCEDRGGHGAPGGGRRADRGPWAAARWPSSGRSTTGGGHLDDLGRPAWSTRPGGDRPEPDVEDPSWRPASTGSSAEIRRDDLALDTGASWPATWTAGRAGPRDAMADDHDWCASALALTEALMLVRPHRRGPPPTGPCAARAVRDDWDGFHVVPGRRPPLDRAAELGRTTLGLRTVDALHLAAADRLPARRYATFDPNQIPAAPRGSPAIRGRLRALAA